MAGGCGNRTIYQKSLINPQHCCAISTGGRSKHHVRHLLVQLMMDLTKLELDDVSYDETVRTHPRHRPRVADLSYNDSSEGSRPPTPSEEASDGGSQVTHSSCWQQRVYISGLFHLEFVRRSSFVQYHGLSLD